MARRRTEARSDQTQEEILLLVLCAHHNGAEESPLKVGERERPESPMLIVWVAMEKSYQRPIEWLQKAIPGARGFKRRARMVGEAGIEPTTPGLEGRCSIRLSYSPLPFLILEHFQKLMWSAQSRPCQPSSRVAAKHIGKYSQRGAQPLGSLGRRRTAGGQIGRNPKATSLWGEGCVADDEIGAARAQRNRMEPCAKISAVGLNKDWQGPSLHAPRQQIDVATRRVGRAPRRSIQLASIKFSGTELKPQIAF